MFRRGQLRKLVLCLGMAAAAIMGAPMRPDEIEDLLRNSQRARIEFSIREDREDCEDPAEPDPESPTIDRAVSGSREYKGAR
jgi:hypothetical protein